MQTSSQQKQQERLLMALRNPAVYPWAVDDMDVIETHISTVILAGDYACKIKKPLDLGFLDFTTLEKRRHFCNEEIRLNSRLAPDYYLDVITFRGSPDHPVLDRDEAGPGDGDNKAIEYAVLMRRFPQEALMDRLAAQGRLPPASMHELARTIAAFHERVPAVPDNETHGSFESVVQPMRENFPPVANVLGREHAGPLRDLQEWMETETSRLHAVIESRRDKGFVRECHGDLHLGNIAWLDGSPLVFDGIEFNAAFRWIDTANEIAFLLMDVNFRCDPGWSRRFLDRYLELTGDFDAMRVMRLYSAYRAMVRAKIHSLRAEQCKPGSTERDAAIEKAKSYLGHAGRYATPGKPELVITCGLSASGKSSHALRLVEEKGFIRLRSDVERKRLHGLQAEHDAGSEPGSGIYSAGATEQTYRHLGELARMLLEAGFSVVVDAAFLEYQRREQFRELSESVGIPFRILYLRARPETLRQRLRSRREQEANVSDATLEVLERQLSEAELPGDAETGWLETVDTDEGSKA